MSDVKYYTGAAWSAKPLKYYNGSTWVEPTVKVWTGGAWFTIGSSVAPVDSIDVSDYAVGNGTTDDTAAFGTAATAAKNASKALYVPTGVYKVTNWVPPTDLVIFGDGGLDEASHIKGFVRWNDGDTFRDLFIGDKTTKGIGPYYASGSITHEGVSFTRCKFRGGGSGNSTLVHPAQGYSTQSIICRDITFESCEWECNYISTYSQSAQDVSWFIDRGTGDISDNIVFEDCHFGTENEQGRTGGTMGGIVFWSSHSESYTDVTDKESGYYDNIYLTRCVFEQADIWNLDFSGAQYNPTSFTENTVYVTDCAFKGLSGAYHSEYTTRVGCQEEPGHDSIWARNIFGIADTNAMKFVKGSSRSQFYDNVFDYRTFRNTVDQQNGSAMIDSIYGINQVIRLGSEEASITIRDNTLLLPTGKYTTLSQQGWIYDPSSRATKTGNTVEWAAGDGPLAAY